MIYAAWTVMPEVGQRQSYHYETDGGIEKVLEALETHWREVFDGQWNEKHDQAFATVKKLIHYDGRYDLADLGHYALVNVPGFVFRMQTTPFKNINRHALGA